VKIDVKKLKELKVGIIIPVGFRSKGKYNFLE